MEIELTFLKMTNEFYPDRVICVHLKQRPLVFYCTKKPEKNKKNKFSLIKRIIFLFEKKIKEKRKTLKSNETIHGSAFSELA